MSGFIGRMYVQTMTTMTMPTTGFEVCCYFYSYSVLYNKIILYLSMLVNLCLDFNQ